MESFIHEPLTSSSIDLMSRDALRKAANAEGLPRPASHVKPNLVISICYVSPRSLMHHYLSSLGK